MDAQLFRDQYMAKNLGASFYGPKIAAIIKTFKPDGSGFVYDPVRVDIPRVGRDEVVVPYTTFESGDRTPRQRSSPPGSNQRPYYTGGMSPSLFPGAQALDAEGMRNMQIPEDVIEGIKPGNVPVYVDTTDTGGAGIIDRYNATGERPGVILQR
tara:strand:+ start:207 stop:668 length:462 start_codon:yes stop_codon:yes gene_type:complete